jgi:signal transduction histidine kinase
MLISFLYYIAHKNMDQRLMHEIEKVVNTVSFSAGQIVVKDSSELKESDFYELTESPYFLQIIDHNSKLLLTSRNVTLFKPLPIKYYNIDTYFYESFDFDNTKFRSGYFPLADSNGNQAAILQISLYERNFQNAMRELLFFNIPVVIFFFILIITASIWTAKKTFKPINQIIETALTFNVQNLNTRIEVNAKPDDEIGRLRDTLNGLFKGIEEYVRELTHFSDQVSHQLMNPLTAIRTEIEYLLKKDRPGNEYKEALVKLEGQTDSMISIVKTLLVIAKSGKIKSESKSVFNLSKLIKNDINNYFNNNHVVYEVEDDLYLRGESEKYLMVIQNLIHNAIKYSPDLLDVKIAARKINKEIIITIEDKGIGIEDSEKEFVFQKFYRSNRAEKLGIKGFGLGLSLVKSIVDEASGKIEILNNKPSGTIFKVTFPSIDLSD